MQAAHGWRCRAKLAVRGPTGRPAVGLFREGSHEVVDIVGEAGPAIALGRSGEPTAAAGASAGRRGAGPAVGAECRAHHPRINEAAALAKQLVAQLRVPPYNELSPPAAAAAASSSKPARTPTPTTATTSGRSSGRASTISSAGSGRANIAGGAGGGTGGGGGLLRYLQLTAVPSNPGGRAEEDPTARVQVVLVLNAQPDLPDTDPRVAPALALCRSLWAMAGPGGPMQPSEGSEELVDLVDLEAGPDPEGGRTAGGGVDRMGGRGGRSGRKVSGQPKRPPLIHSLWLNFQPDARSNAVLGPAWRHVAGPAAAWQAFGGVAAAVGPGSFVQANYGAMQRVLREMEGMVPDGARVTELHAGIGVIGLSLAARRRLASLRLVEINPAAAAPFAASLAALRRRERRRQEQQGEELPRKASQAGHRFEETSHEAPPSPSPAAAPDSLAPGHTRQSSRDASGSIPEESAPPSASSAPPTPASALGSLAAAAPHRPDVVHPPPHRLPDPIEYITAEAGSDPARFLAGCNVLVVDPPRKGLGPALLQALTHGTAAPDSPTRGSGASTGDPALSNDDAEAASSGQGGVSEQLAEPLAKEPQVQPAELPSRLVYLSCGFRALQSDLAALLAGGWVLRSATAHMFFPGTDSLETLVLLTRGSGEGQEAGVGGVDARVED